MTNPTLITTPFASSGDKNTIPETNTDTTKPQLASMQAGFPQITQKKITDGGIPPERNDFNGILNLVTENISFLNKGGVYEYDATFANSIGGYPLNARIMLTSGEIVQNTVAGNTANPNSDMTGWYLFDDKLAITTVESIADLANLEVWDGRTVLVGDDVYQYNNQNWNLLTYEYDEYTLLSSLVKSKSDGIDVSSVLNTANTNNLNVLIDLNCTVGSTVNITNGTKLKGVSGKWITQNADMVFSVTATNAELLNLNIDTNGKTYGIYENGVQNKITNIHFKGDVGHYILSSGIRPISSGCHHDAGYNQITPFVFSGATDFLVEKAVLNEYTGFGIQARWCNGGVMRDCYATSDMQVFRVNTSSGKTTYDIDLGKSFSRFGVTLTGGTNGVEIPIAFTQTTLSDNTHRFTISDPLGTQVLSVYATNTLETYQINSGCNDVTIIENISTSTGDSNIVVGCDYHWNGSNWVLDPSNVVASDEPVNSQIIRNNTDKALFASIAFNHGRGTNIIEGNRLGNAALSYDTNGAFNTNILINTTGVVSKNHFKKTGSTVSNNITCLRAGTEGFGIGEAGLIISDDNVYSQSTNVNPNSNTYKALFFGAASESNIRRQGTIVGANFSSIGNEIQTAFESTYINQMPSNTANFSFAAANGFLNKETNNNVGGLNSVFVNAGTTVDISANQGMRNRLSNKVVRVRFWCSGVGRVSFFPFFNGSTSSTLGVDVNETTFVQKEMYFPTANLTQFLIRLTASTTLYIQDIDIAYKDYS